MQLVTIPPTMLITKAPHGNII